MRSMAFRDEPAAFLGSMAWVAVGSFVLGFGGYLVFGLNALG